MPAEIEKIIDCCVCAQESVSLPGRLEPTHPSLSHAGRFMRLLSPIILILLSTVDRFRNQFPMGNAIACQLVSYDLPRFTAM